MLTIESYRLDLNALLNIRLPVDVMRARNSAGIRWGTDHNLYRGTFYKASLIVSTLGGTQIFKILNMARIKLIEHFRVPPRWLFVKITDDEGGAGWGEATLEGHTEAVEGMLEGIMATIMGLEAK